MKHDYMPAAAAALLMLSGSAAQAWAGQNAPLELAPRVVTAVVSQSPLIQVTDPGLPRQPLPASDVADYLKTFPGFAAIRSGGSNSDPVLRGLFGSRLKLLNDGGEMLGACPSRMDSPSSYLAPGSFDRLTVIKGPQSVRWGPGASAGTVLLERLPESFDEPGQRLDTSLVAGGNTRRDASLDGAIGSRDGYLRLTANRSRSGDYRDGDGERVPSRWNKWNTDLTLGWTPGEDTLIEFMVGRGDGEARYAGRGMDGAQFLRESLGTRVQYSFGGAALEQVELLWYYNKADHVMDNFSLRSPDPNASMMPMRNPRATQVERRTQGLRLSSDWAWESISLVAGADAQRSEARRRSSAFSMAEGYSDYRQFPLLSDALFHQAGLFAELTFSPGQSQRWITGARLDRSEVRDQRGSLSNPMGMSWANPSAGKTRGDTLPSGFVRYEQELQWAPVSWYAGLGHSQRFADYWELFSASTGPAPGAVRQAFETADPERTTQLDVGLQYRSTRLEAWVSAYLGRIDDYLLFRYEPRPSGHIFTAVDNVDARIMGAELGGSWALTEQWKTDASLAWAWGKNRSDGQPLAQMPPLEARLGLAFEARDWSAGALWRLVARQTRTALNQGNVVGRDLGDSAGFGVFALNAAYRVSPALQLSAGVDNLFDRTYSEHLNLAGNAGFGFPAEPTRINEPGRTLWTRLDLSF
ncbi:TonB-dependent copper receptor [Pseudomonas sp. WN033]|nr:TonB-dependent copper receptor [Pseudomonas sp. WN033]